MADQDSGDVRNLLLTRHRIDEVGDLIEDERLTEKSSVNLTNGVYGILLSSPSRCEILFSMVLTWLHLIGSSNMQA